MKHWWPERFRQQVWMSGKEPLELSNPLSQLKDSNKLIITPHLAWASVEARTRCVQGVYENIKAFMRGENRNVVNL